MSLPFIWLRRLGFVRLFYSRFIGSANSMPEYSLFYLPYRSVLSSIHSRSCFLPSHSGTKAALTTMSRLLIKFNETVNRRQSLSFTIRLTRVPGHWAWHFLSWVAVQSQGEWKTCEPCTLPAGFQEFQTVNICADHSHLSLPLICLCQTVCQIFLDDYLVWKLILWWEPSLPRTQYYDKLIAVS